MTTILHATVHNVNSTNFPAFLQTEPAVPHLLMFSAVWHEPCKDMQSVMAALSQTHKGVYYGVIEVEENVELGEKYQIQSVPTFILYRNSSEIDRINGANASLLTERVVYWENQTKLNANVHSIRQLEEKINVKPTTTSIETNNPSKEQPSSNSLTQRIEQLLNSVPVLLFMKGAPAAPRCGFSRQIVALLQSKNIKFDTFDILMDEEIRQGLKEYSKWPTYPQLYVKGELVGGLDVVKELAETDELIEMVPSECIIQQ